MSGLLRAELLKLRTTRTAAGMAAGMLVIVCLVVLVHGLALGASDAGLNAEMHVFAWGELGVLFAALLGAISITGEIRNGMIRPTFLVTPRRRRVLAAKLAVSALAGALYGAAAELLTVGLGSAVLAARGIPIRLDGAGYRQLVLGGVVGAALWAPLGLGLGAVLRSQVATLVGLCAWLLFVENVLLGQFPAVIRYFPAAAAAAIAGRSTITGESPTNPPLLAPLLGVLVLSGYAAAMTLAGIMATERLDVP